MPAVGLIGAGVGLYQAISGGVKASNAQHDLENQANSFQPNASILDYYNKALAKYNPNPYDSLGYQQQNNQIQRNLATGINSFQNGRRALGAVGGLVQGADDSSAKAAVTAQMQGNQDLATLGRASAMKTAEEQKKFDMLYNLKAMKAGAGASEENTGISNLYGGLSNYAYMKGRINNNTNQNNNTQITA